MADRVTALALLAKAEQDLSILNIPPQTWVIPDEVWGFHAQQAVEKLIKALLSMRSVRFPFTHRLFELGDLLSDSGMPFPPELEPLLDLTPYAADLRYSEISQEFAASLDRQAILRMIAELRELAIIYVKP